eukprot:2771483-Pyramimonas_sp.AAC.1
MAAPVRLCRPGATLKMGLTTKQYNGFPWKRFDLNEDGDEFSQPFLAFLLCFGSGCSFFGKLINS